MKKTARIIGIISVVMILITAVSCRSKTDKTTVSYQLNGGELIGAPTEFSNGEVPDFSKIEPTRSGYRFDGWYTDEALKNKLNTSADFNEALKLYAKWTKINSITYVLDGAEAIDLPQSYVSGDEIEIQDYPATKSGFVFFGWYFDGDFQERAYIDVDTEGDLTLYPRFLEAPKLTCEIPDNVTPFISSQSSLKVKLSDYFDSKGLSVEFSAGSDDQSVATVSVDGDVLTVTLLKNETEASITVKVCVGGVEYASDTFTARGKAVTKIACIGDSLTAVRKNIPENCYPFCLQAIFGEECEVGNFGKSGTSVTEYGVSGKYMDTEEYTAGLNFDADVIIIMLGTNDAKPWNTGAKEKFKEDYISLVQSYQAASPNASIYLVTSPTVKSDNSLSIPPSIIDKEIVKMQLELAEELALPVLDFHTEFSDAAPFDNNLCLEDGVHFTQSGAEFLADLVYDFIKNN